MQKARQVIQTKQSEVIGTVSITPMGAWNADLNYEKDNYVRHNGATYMARQPNKGIEPGVSQAWEQYWMLSIKDGASATVEVGETTTLPAGEQATVTNSGSDTNVVLDFAIPQGIQGETATITVGRTQTGEPGSLAIVENAGDEHNAIFNFTIPQGLPGVDGNDPNAVHFTPQVLMDEQQGQARANIGAADSDTLTAVIGGNVPVGKATGDASGNTITSFYAHNLTFTIDSSTFVLTATLLGGDGSTLATQTIDLPLESVVVSGSYDDTTKEVVLTLQNGSEVRFSVADLVDGLASQSALDAEVQARQQADTTLQNNINAEATARQQADTALGQRIDDLNATDIALSVADLNATNVADGMEELVENISQITGGGVVTGVKGNAETTYRTGQVNLTPANIGAATSTALQNVINGTTPVAKAENADNATNAVNADNADHATSADTATSATNATHATSADSATNATNATNATKATQDAQGNVISTTYAKTSELGYNAVLYTTAQTLTEEQKAQARANIGVDSGGGGKDIANATVTLGASLTFNGSAQEQTIASVILNGDTLAEGTDYKVAGNIATDAGNYTLAIMGIGDYTGTLWVDWSIAKAQGSISVSESEVQIIGLAGTQKQVAVTIEGGYGDLVAVSSSPSIVTAGVAGSAVTLTLVGSGSATVTVMLVGNYQASAQISVSADYVHAVLADNTPAQIRYIADNDLGANYWAVGDTYPVPLNGTVGTVQYDNLTVWAYILGFNHNPDREGEHLIHFGGFKTTQTDGVDICLVDSHYGNDSTSGAKWFNMNHSSNTNSGGWKGCDMRYDILGSTDTNNGEPTTTCATDPVSGTLMAAFPADLRAVMRPATKYTDNTGGGNNNASYVTATQDYMPLLAEFEVQGARRYANSTEQNYQTQYAYYANGNSKVKRRQTATGSAADWWCRSPNASGSRSFCGVYVDGRASNYNAYFSLGVSPAFFI